MAKVTCSNCGGTGKVREIKENSYYWFRPRVSKTWRIGFCETRRLYDHYGDGTSLNEAEVGDEIVRPKHLK